jgi:hypothetical protein
MLIQLLVVSLDLHQKTQSFATLRLALFCGHAEVFEQDRTISHWVFEEAPLPDRQLIPVKFIPFLITACFFFCGKVLHSCCAAHALSKKKRGALPLTAEGATATQQLPSGCQGQGRSLRMFYYILLRSSQLSTHGVHCTHATCDRGRGRIRASPRMAPSPRHSPRIAQLRMTQSPQPLDPNSAPDSDSRTRTSRNR